VSKAVVDTGVFVDYVDRKAPYHEAAKAIIDSLGQLELILPSITLTEICYVCARIFRAAGVKKAFEKSVEFVEWLYSHPAVRVVDSFALGIEAAKLKLHYGIALADCYVLALSKLEGCKAVFRKREGEMPEEIENDFDVIFLEDYVGGVLNG